MGYLLSLNPQIHALDAHTQVRRRVPDGKREFFGGERQSLRISARFIELEEVFWIHVYL